MAKKATKTEEVEEDVELEDLETDEVEESGSKKSKAAEVTFGVADLCALANKLFKPAKPYTTRDMRTLIRKMAREDNPRVNREIVPGNRTRYDWSGKDDPEVKAILKALKGGELEAGKKEALEKLKESKAKKKAAEGKDTKGKKGKGKKEAPVEDDDDDVEIEIEDDDD